MRIFVRKINDALDRIEIKEKISNWNKLFEKEICSDLSTAFWNHKQHIGYLSYVVNFDEKNFSQTLVQYKWTSN